MIIISSSEEPLLALHRQLELDGYVFTNRKLYRAEEDRLILRKKPES